MEYIVLNGENLSLHQFIQGSEREETGDAERGG